MIIDLNVTAKTIKHLKHRNKSFGVGFGSSFSDMTPKAQATKEKNKSDFIKINNFQIHRILSRKLKDNHRIVENIYKLHIW